MSQLRQRHVPAPEDAPPSINQPATAPSDIRPAVATPVIVKLLFFTLLLVTVPLGTYFTSLRLFSNSTVAGALAAVMANVVLIGYLIAAVWDDQGEQSEKDIKKDFGKKGQ